MVEHAGLISVDLFSLILFIINIIVIVALIVLIVRFFKRMDRRFEELTRSLENKKNQWCFYNCLKIYVTE